MPVDIFSNEHHMEEFLGTVALSCRAHAASALARAVDSLSRLVPGNNALALSVPKYLDLARKKAKSDYEVSEFTQLFSP